MTEGIKTTSPGTDAVFPASARCTNVNTFGILPHRAACALRKESLGTRLWEAVNLTKYSHGKK